MSSKLSARKRRASSETEDTFFELGKNRHIIIDLRPTHAVLRLRGCRRRWAVGYRAEGAQDGAVDERDRPGGGP